MAGVVHIPWYATLFRAQAFADALTEFAPTALRYGATDYRVYRSRDDEYKFTHMVSFEDKPTFEAYWYGPDFNHFRAIYSSYYQVPILYVWQDLLIADSLDGAPAAAGTPNGT